MADTTDQQLKILEEKVKRIKALARELGQDVSTIKFGSNLLEQATVIKNTLENLEEKALKAANSFENIQDSLKKSLEILDKKNTSVNILKKSFNSLDKILTELVADEKGYGDLTKNQLKNASRKLQIEKDLAERTAKRLLDTKKLIEFGDKERSIYQAIQDGVIKVGKAKNGTIEATIGELKGVEKISSAYKITGDEIKKIALLVEDLTKEEVEALGVVKKGEDVYGSTLEKVKNRLDIERKTQSAMGLTGALLDNINKVGVRAFGGLGLNLGAFENELEAGAEKVRELGKAFADKNFDKAKSLGFEGGEEAFTKIASGFDKGGSALDRFAVRLATLKAGLPSIKKGIKEAFADPLTISVAVIAKLFSAFKDVDKATVEFERLNGSAAAANIQVMSMNLNLTNTVDLLKQAGAFTQLTGFNAEAFSKEIVTGAARAVDYLGFTNEQAAKLGVYAQATGQSYANTTKSLVSGVNTFNSMNKTAVSHGLVMRDITNSSDAVAASLGSSMDRLTGAASAARRLGLELKDLDSIANSLLDFESSIEAELEAQLLTGKNLNLTKARELALSNDLEGVGKELFKNSASLFEFGKMNRIQQDSYAKALGLSRDQLAKIAYQRAKENNLTGEALRLATGMTEKQLESMEYTVTMEKIVTKLTQSFMPLVKLFSKILENSIAARVVFAGIATIIVARIVLGFRAANAQITMAAAMTAKMKSDMIATAAASKTITPIPGRNVGRGPGGRFASLKGGGMAPTVTPSVPKGGMMGGLRGLLRSFGPWGWLLMALISLPELTKLLTPADDMFKLGSKKPLLKPKGSLLLNPSTGTGYQLNENDQTVFMAGTNLLGPAKEQPQYTPQIVSTANDSSSKELRMQMNTLISKIDRLTEVTAKNKNLSFDPYKISEVVEIRA